jgi:exopolyphosphatase/guanosine-5'-triphosphate,3'-diphosphate pyrophosphatase
MSGPPLVVPRWEWRTFGATFGEADALLTGLTPTAVEESDEVYLLSQAGDNVKIRAELIDIKVLREVDRRGLERWEPVLKASFPIAVADVAAAFEAFVTARTCPDRLHLDRVSR